MEERNEPRRFARHLILLTVVIPMILAGLVIWGILYLFSWLGDWSWPTVVVFSPLIYLAWLLLFLWFCARNSQRLGSKNPKPRFVKFERSGGRVSVPGMRTVAICMFRFGIITSLPLVRTLLLVASCRNLVMRSYSPAVRVAHNAFVWGTVMDPDLTEIGEGAVIGDSARVAAHTFTSRPDGSYAYVSAAIKIKAGATIGGASSVEHGCVIGEYAVVEPLSLVAPFTIIPPGETWGGVPARCLRKSGERKPSPTR